MIIKLPLQKKEIKDGKINKIQSEKEFNLDMSLAAQVRFESRFPELASREDLAGYSERICKIEELSSAVLISKMKMLYCWFDTNLSFIEFLQLFDFSDIKYVEKLVNAIKTAFELILDSSAEKN